MANKTLTQTFTDIASQIRYTRGLPDSTKMTPAEMAEAIQMPDAIDFRIMVYKYDSGTNWVKGYIKGDNHWEQGLTVIDLAGLSVFPQVYTGNINCIIAFHDDVPPEWYYKSALIAPNAVAFTHEGLIDYNNYPCETVDDLVSLEEMRANPEPWCQFIQGIIDQNSEIPTDKGYIESITYKDDNGEWKRNNPKILLQKILSSSSSGESEESESE